MKYIAIIVLFIVSFNYFGQNDKCKLQIGTYGSYLDISTYRELTLNEDYSFKFVNRGFTGISDVYHGKWKVKKRKLILYDFEKKIRPMPFEDYWDCWIIKGEKIISPRGSTLDLIK
jgi:hypothetical protein